VFTGLFTAEASTLSVNNRTLNDLIKVYPTVSNGNFKVSTNKNISEGYLKVFNINGQEVYSSKVDFSRNSVKNVSLKGASGIYIVKFTSNGKHSTHKILIK
jgi:hypothetical protein